ncbi:adenylosuccinate synthetase [Elysia marginata]|uniref:Adenylosuccinate synthetase n=1 Tax=Elysia marginata TaxID=1093978 RepID=A0AAV4FM51_9GAST|nr:adenylosuccinate synthetase [Elysia marginata]
MAVDVLLGLQWGDEGKGKVVDIFTQNYSIVARFQGGPNAGHTLEFDGNKYVLHTIPSGIFHKGTVNIIGNGVVIDPVTFRDEISKITSRQQGVIDQLFISRKAHLILPTHRLLDKSSEISKGKSKIGSTLKGIGPAYMDKTGRNGLRVGDLESKSWRDKYRSLVKKHEALIGFNTALDYDLEALERDFFESLKFIKSFTFIDSESYLHRAIRDSKNILAEGAQGTLLDVDFGTYPYVTSSNTTVAGACIGLGVPPSAIVQVFGIFKAYTTRVGSGPFPTELFDKSGETLCKVGCEFGATTGRKRRCGWLDLVALKYACEVNGVTQLIMTKGDVLSGFETIKVCKSYKIKDKTYDDFPYKINETDIEPVYQDFKGWEADISKLRDYGDLPIEMKKYIAFLEEKLGLPIKIISVGPDRSEIILR